MTAMTHPLSSVSIVPIDYPTRLVPLDILDTLRSPRAGNTPRYAKRPSKEDGEMTKVAESPAVTVLRSEDYERAKDFYIHKLGLTLESEFGPDGRQGIFDAGNGTRIMIYERPGIPAPQNSAFGFMVDDIEATVSEMRSAGVDFMDLDMPEIDLTTHGGIADMGDTKTAWFQDTEGNIGMIGQMA
jgi:predicted enzyme related to lactoylglutathione lyase